MRGHCRTFPQVFMKLDHHAFSEGWMVVKREKILKTGGADLPEAHTANIETSFDIPQSHRHFIEEVR